MGNSMGCSASGERLVSAARDGDLVEAKMLLECNLERYSTFGSIVSLLLEKGTDVNSRDYCGQTALMQACGYGHWEVVQTLFFFIDVTRVDYLSGRTALHFAAVNGLVGCIRLVVADFVPSVPYESIAAKSNGDRGDPIVGSTPKHYAACGGNLKCCQILIARGASQMPLNCNG